MLPPSKEQRKRPFPNRILFRDFLELFQGNDVILLAIHGGARAKDVILEGLVQVNGETDTRRGRKLYAEDVITFDGEEVKIEN